MLRLMTKRSTIFSYSEALRYYKEWLDIYVNPNKLIIGDMISSGGFKEVSKGRYGGICRNISAEWNCSLDSKANGKASYLQESFARWICSQIIPKSLSFMVTAPWEWKKTKQIMRVNELCELGDLTRFVETNVFDQMTVKDQMLTFFECWQ